jgi:hypothetical protein
MSGVPRQLDRKDTPPPRTARPPLTLRRLRRLRERERVGALTFAERRELDEVGERARKLRPAVVPELPSARQMLAETEAMLRQARRTLRRRAPRRPLRTPTPRRAVRSRASRPATRRRVRSTPLRGPDDADGGEPDLAGDTRPPPAGEGGR